MYLPLRAVAKYIAAPKQAANISRTITAITGPIHFLTFLWNGKSTGWINENGSFGSYCILFVTVTATFPIVGVFCGVSFNFESILADEALLPASFAFLVLSRLEDNEFTLSSTLKLDSLLLFNRLSNVLLSLLEILSLLLLLPLSSVDCRRLPPDVGVFPLSLR